MDEAYSLQYDADLYASIDAVGTYISLPEALLLNIDQPPVGGVVGMQYTLVRLSQYQNAHSPIEVTPSGIVILVSFLQL